MIMDKDIKNILDSQNIVEVTPLNEHMVYGGSGELFIESYDGGKSKIDLKNVLKPDTINIPIPNIDFVHITNIGYIDNKLHIQTKWNSQGIDDYGFLYLTDISGNELDIDVSNICFNGNKIIEENNRRILVTLVVS